jgi:hypothetical protein
MNATIQTSRACTFNYEVYEKHHDDHDYCNNNDDDALQVWGYAGRGLGVGNTIKMTCYVTSELTGFFERGNENSSPVKGGEFLK